MQVRVFRRAQSGSGRIVRPGPTFTVIVQVPEHVEVLLPARRAGIEGLAAREFHAGDDEMELMMPGMVVPHPEDIALIRLQAGKGHGLEVVHDACFLLGRHDFVRMPGKDPGRELPFGVQGVDQLSR